jgi:hypothetical protein
MFKQTSELLALKVIIPLSQKAPAKRAFVSS